MQVDDPNDSGRPNRVAPDGSAHAVSARGLVWGNRGQLLDADGAVARHSKGSNWVCCVLEFHGRRRTQWRPGRLTELYFLDEPTALAAGHRPCGECRHADHVRFRAAWQAAHPGEPVDARSIDAALHADRLVAGGRGVERAHRRHRAEREALPDGAVVEHEGQFWLVWAGSIHAWGLAGYGERRRFASLPPAVDVLTPARTVATLRAGYVPRFVHPSLS